MSANTNTPKTATVTIGTGDAPFKVSAGPVSLDKALELAAELEVCIGEIANGQRKPAKLPLEHMVKLIAFARQQTAAPQPEATSTESVAGRDAISDMARASAAEATRLLTSDPGDADYSAYARAQRAAQAPTAVQAGGASVLPWYLKSAIEWIDYFMRGGHRDQTARRFADNARAALATAAVQGDAYSAVPTAALRDVMAERRRQVEAEGWTPKHDDEHGDGAMAKAAACYALGSRTVSTTDRPYTYVSLWPWGRDRWKPTPNDRRRELIKAAALTLAEIERLDRAATTPAAPGPAASSAVPGDTHAFKNFHRLLCERFDYCHDERDWRRDQVSLMEHIARKVGAAASPAPTPEAKARGA